MDPCHAVAESMATLRNVPGDLRDLAKEVSMQSVEGVLWFLLASSKCKTRESNQGKDC